MPRHPKRLINSLLHVFCVFALVVSCGLPEALHEIGHALTHTDCLVTHDQPTDSGITVSANESCWIQTLVANFAHHSAHVFVANAVSDFSLNVLTVAVFPMYVFLVNNRTHWQSPRGPPAV